MRTAAALCALRRVARPPWRRAAALTLCSPSPVSAPPARFKDAAKECSTALEIQPSSFKGLYFRAKALEQQGLYKMALADVQAINKSDGATDETRDAEKRLKDIMAGRRSGPVNGDSAPARPAGRAGGRLPLFVAKCSLGSEVRNVHMPHSQSYAELLTAVRAKFPEAGPFLLKYVDRQGDLVTITQRADLQLAMQEALAAYEKQVAGSHGPKLLAAQAPPPIRIQLVPVAGEVRHGACGGATHAWSAALCALV